MGSLNRFERTVFSQAGEDGILEELARLLDPPRFFVEFGVENGLECNTRLLRHRGWVGLCWDDRHADPDRGLFRESITAENLNAVFARYRVPDAFGILSVDVDGNDYHLWHALHPRYRPLVVVIEYNAAHPPPASVTVPYDPAFRWDGSAYQGASFAALVKLGRQRGYAPVAANRFGVNLFFVDQDYLSLLPPEVRAESADPACLYQPPRYGPAGRGHPPDPLRRPWLSV